MSDWLLVFVSLFIKEWILLFDIFFLNLSMIINKDLHSEK